MSLSPRDARAESRELSMGVQPVYGLTYMDDRSPSGGGGNLHIAYGITDAVGVQLHGGATVHPLAAITDEKTMNTDPGGTLLTWQASAGIVYALDVVRIVPFFEASLGVLGVWTQTDPAPGKKNPTVESTVQASASLGLGGDYLISRRLAVGVAVRYHAVLTDLGRIPIYLTVGPRLLLRFGL